MNLTSLRITGAVLYGLFAGVAIAMMQYAAGQSLDWWIVILALGAGVVGYASWESLVEIWGTNRERTRAPRGWRSASNEVRNSLVLLTAGVILALVLAGASSGGPNGGWLKIAWLVAGLLAARVWTTWSARTVPGVVSGASVGAWLTILAIIPASPPEVDAVDVPRAVLTIVTIAFTGAVFGAAVGAVSDRWLALHRGEQ